ncbi:33044_t:CDS:1, partial [Racocetra persica]
RVEYLNQLVRIEGPPLPPEIEETKNKKAIERSLRPFISGKLVGYMNQDKKKGCEFNLSVDYIFVLKDLQKNKYELCLNEMLWKWDEAENPDQWTVDRINNKLDHIEGNICLVCLECNWN